MNDLKETIARVSWLLRQDVLELKPLGSGRNSRTYCAWMKNGARYAVKHYPAVDRLEVEFSAYRFLHANLMYGNTPQSVEMDRDHLLGVYEYISGTAVDSRMTTLTDVESAAAFILELADIACRQPSCWRMDAAEARYSFAGVIETIQSRFQCLRQAALESPGYDALYHFLSHRFEPFLATVVPWGERRLSAAHLSLAHEIEPAARILSPSDFGFHNAIRREAGDLVYLDFEYFGWDDPVKTASDFILHPAMTLTSPQKKRFIAMLCHGLRQPIIFQARLPVAYALFGLKWCMILLNEYLPKHRSRRRFAGDARGEEEMLLGQLSKAEYMLDTIEKTYQEFPYFE